MPIKPIERPTRLHALETFIQRNVENWSTLFEKMREKAQERLSLSYMESPVHKVKFRCDLEFKRNASECYSQKLNGGSLETAVASTLEAILDEWLQSPHAPRVKVLVEVSEQARNVEVFLEVNYLEAQQSKVPA